jgi:hypothetical protein
MRWVRLERPSPREEEDARLSVRLEQISGLDRWLLPELLPA